jgi:hypothetical protein
MNMELSLSISISTRRHAVGARDLAAPSFISISLAWNLHRGQLPQPLPQPLELPPAHRAFFADPIGTLGEDVKFTLLGKELDCDTCAGLLPGLGQQPLLETREASFGRANQILHWRIAGSHLRQHRLGGDAAIHHPDPPRAAVLPFDLGEEPPQRGAVRSVAGQHLVGQGQTVRGDHQRDHHLRAVGPFVPAVAVAPLVALRHVRGIDLEIRTGQIVEQHIEVRVEQVTPSRREMREQRVFVRQQNVMAGVELVRLRQSEVGPQQVGHGAVAEPLAMQLPLAARRDQPIRDQHLQDLVPARPLAAGRQTIRPELVQLQLLPQLPGQPAGAPLPRPAQPHVRQANLDG